MAGTTTDPSDPGLGWIKPDGQQDKYLVLSDEEKAKGYVRPVRREYIHLACGGITTMGLSIAETYARNPKFYSGTFCAVCGNHFHLTDAEGKPTFLWKGTDEGVGS